MDADESDSPKARPRRFALRLSWEIEMYEYASSHEAPAPESVAAGFNEEAAQESRAMIGQSPAMKSLREQLQRVAPTNASVLIVGESGTGKEVVAKTLHELSDQRDKPFVAINCGAIPENLIEAELFGYERGSFTGAVRAHNGYFERAGDGTILLDEITEMPIGMQAKLLRVLESRHFCKVGGTREVRVFCRIIAATNRDPERALADGNLRADLLYRLAVFPIHIPPLRNREGDAELLAEHFLAGMNAQEQTAKTLSADSYRLLREHIWPGNVRELRNAVQRAFILADKDLDLRSALVKVTSCSVNEDNHMVHVAVGTPLSEVERYMIGATLRRCGGNKTKAAAMLGVSLKTLYNRLHDYRRSDDNRSLDGDFGVDLEESSPLMPRVSTPSESVPSERVKGAA